MRTKVNISIPEPCSEKFSSFKKTASGGFCNSCCKEVIDFTKRTDKEILTYFKTKPKNTCGHFYEDQLKTYYEPRNSYQTKLYNWAHAFSFSVISLFSTNTLVAQKNTIDTVKTIPTKNNKDLITTTTASIKGRILSKHKRLPLKGVLITINHNTNTETISDYKGEFELKNIKKGDSISFHHPSYKPQKITIKDNQQKLNIKLEETLPCILGSGRRVLGGKISFDRSKH